MSEFFEMQQEGLLDEYGEYIGPMPTDKDFNFTHHCKKCKKGFYSQGALNQHNKAKHEKVN